MYCLPPPSLWHQYVDDTFVIQKEIFLQHINSVVPAIQFTVEYNKEDGASPSWTPLLNQSMMVSSQLLYTGSPHTQTITYSGTATIISQLNIVSLLPLPIGPTQSVTILSSSKMKWSISGKLLPIVNTPGWLWTRWRKDLPDLPVRLMMG